MPNEFPKKPSSPSEEEAQYVDDTPHQDSPEQTPDQDASTAPDDKQDVSLPRRVTAKINSWLGRGNRPLAFTTTLLTTLILAIAVGISSYDSLNHSYARLSHDYEQSQSTLAEEREYAELLEARIDSLSNDLGEARSERDEYKSQIANYEDQQATIDDLTARLEELNQERDSLIEERDTIQGQLDAKKLAEEQAQREQAEQITSSGNTGYGRTVYWTPNGKVYHLSPNCPTLRRSHNVYSGSISASGKPRCCKVCG